MKRRIAFWASTSLVALMLLASLSYLTRSEQVVSGSPGRLSATLADRARDSEAGGGHRLALARNGAAERMGLRGRSHRVDHGLHICVGIWRAGTDLGAAADPPGSTRGLLRDQASKPATDAARVTSLTWGAQALAAATERTGGGDSASEARQPLGSRLLPVITETTAAPSKRAPVSRDREACGAGRFRRGCPAFSISSRIAARIVSSETARIRRRRGHLLERARDRLVIAGRRRSFGQSLEPRSSATESPSPARRVPLRPPHASRKRSPSAMTPCP